MEDFISELDQFMTDALRRHITCSGHASHLTASEQDEIIKLICYPLKAGGKRIRPLLMSFIAEACGTTAQHPAVLNCAAALEFVHTYSLVHDDLPCMDNDDFRRGKPTTHKVFGEANALLTGDALLTHAFQLLGESTDAGLDPDAAVRAVGILARCSGAGGMIAGQWKDLSYTKSTTPAEWENLGGIHALKTGALLGAACSLGIISGISLTTDAHRSSSGGLVFKTLISSAERLGTNIGLAFQITDDILDVTSNSAQLGKTAGKDLAQEKLTAVKVFGLERAKAEAVQLTNAAMNTISDLQKMTLQLNPLLAADPLAVHRWERVSEFVRQLLLRTS